MTIFFSSESWDVVFFKNKKAGPKGGPPEALFWFEISEFPWNFRKFYFFQTKIGLRVVPLLVPLFHFWNIQHLSFHWKKNHPFIFFRKNFKFWNVWDFIEREGRGRVRIFQIIQFFDKKYVFNSVMDVKSKSLQKKDKRIIFCSESWDVVFFKSAIWVL